jgi:drug/metabolite transporter (DMT)-like permease
MQPLGAVSLGLTLLTVALWGGTPTAVKYSLEALPVMAIACVRFAMAAIFMIAWLRFEGTRLKLEPGQGGPALVMGLLLFAQIALFTLAIEMSNASHSTLFINTFIFWVVGIEHFITRSERLSARKIVGLIVAAVGVLLVLTRAEGGASTADVDAPNVWGDVVMLGSALVLGVKVIYTKQAVKTVEPGKLIFWHNVIGVMLFGAWSLAFENATLDKLTPPAVWGLLYQGVVVAGFCFAVQAYLLKKHSASKISVFSFATPLFGTTIAVLFRGDELSPWLAAAAVCVAAGILIVSATPPGERPA